MSGTTRDITSEARPAFMARVRGALGHTVTATPSQDPPPVDESIARLVGPGSDLVAVFADRAAGVGMRVHRTTAGAAGGVITGVLRSLGARRVVSSMASSPHTAPMQDQIAREGFELIDWRSAPGFAAHYDADAGLTGVEGAVAESGSLVCSSGPGRGRALSLVPPVHIAVVRASQIVPDLIDFWKSVPASARELPSSVVLITGPSKTADIEGVLITGVHGPREVHVVLVEDA